MIYWNIPQTITQGDRITWTEQLDDYHPATNTLRCYIRGFSALNLDGVRNSDGWDFEITSAQSETLQPGKYKAQFVISDNLLGNKTTLGTINLLAAPSFESLTELETRTPDEIELEEITKAIAKLVSGAVSEYEIGDRRMRYQDLGELTKRQAYLRRRIAIAEGLITPGGRNIGVRFSS